MRPTFWQRLLRSRKGNLKQLNDWVNTFYSWDLVDQACINLLRFIPEARENIFIWCDSDEEFVKRTAFSLIAVLAVHEKESDFEMYFDILKEGSRTIAISLKNRSTGQ